MSTDPWSSLADQAERAALQLPPLPLFAAVLRADGGRWFEELGYTFWNQELLQPLAARLREEPVSRWLEVAAGTGRLAAELARRGVRVAATDSHAQAADRVRSYHRPIRYGSWVGELNARRALEELRPDGVLCSWPPLGSGLVPDLLSGALRGADRLRVLLCIGEPSGATEAPVDEGEVPSGWRLERWPECDRYLVGFNDAREVHPFGSASALLIYRRR